MSAPGTSAELSSVLQGQRDAWLRDGPPDARVREDRIDRCIELLLANAERFAEALCADFGHRSTVQTIMMDIIGVLPSLKHTRKHLRRWMRPQRVSAGPLGWLGASARVERVPRGVVGIISPWNFPVGLSIQPLAQAFAAGNVAMLKVSELTPRTGELLRTLVKEHFSPEEAVVVTGGPEVAAEFSRLPFDLMFFTGATGVARHVQRACADNLVPCVFELGGKSPVVVSPSAKLDDVAARLAFWKTLNAGQICLAPDYVFVPEGREHEFVEAMRRAVTRLFPTLLDNPDFSSLVAARHRQRLLDYLEDAKTKGAEVIELNPAGEDFSAQRAHKFPPTLVLKATADMLILQEEIFGPLLPVMGYGHIDEVIGWVNARPRPLATYFFGREDETCRRYLDRTISGGVTINDVALHAACEDLPFGGVGDSGMGSYHGRFGFETFSHPRSIVSAPAWIQINALMSPPYGKRTRKVLAWMLGRELRLVRARRVRAEAP